MQQDLDRKLGSAIAAGWRVLLIEVAFVSLVWVAFRTVAAAHPDAMLALFGPDATWSEVVHVTLSSIAAFKVALWLQAALLLWAWMWKSMMRGAKSKAAQAPPPTTAEPARTAT